MQEQQKRAEFGEKSRKFGRMAHMQNDVNVGCCGQLFVAKGMFSTRQMVHVHLPVSVAGIPFLEKGPVKKSCPAGE